MTTRSGRVKRYPLTGPAVPGFERRVFMVDLGHIDYRALELARNGDVLSRIERSQKELALEDRFEQFEQQLGPDFGSEPTDEAERALERQMDECIASKAAGG